MRSNVPRLQTILVLVALAVMLPLAASGAFFECFGRFEPYDDEGYAMITVASHARGYALYDEVFSQYGPFFYVVTWRCFEIGPLDLDHATVRWLVLSAWLAITLASSVLVWRSSRNAALSAITFAVAFAHLHRLAVEPGHPQSLVVFCLILVALLPAWLAHPRPHLCCILLGVVGAAIALTKVNIGVYVMLAVVLAIVEHLPRTVLVRWVGRASWAAAIALPWAVMHARLNEPWAVHYAAAVTGTVILIAVTLRFSARAQLVLFRARDVLAFGAAFLLSAAVLLAFALLRGTSLHGLLDGVFLGPLSLAVDYSQQLDPVAFGVPALVGSAVLWIAVQQLQGHSGHTEALGIGLLAVAKLVFGLCVLRSAWIEDPSSLIEVYAPFLWLIVLPAAGKPLDPARVFLAAIAALQLLHAFPVAGSQMSWATLLVLIAAVIAVADAWEYVGLRARRVLTGSVVPALLGGAASVMIVIYAVDLMRVQARSRRQGYGALCPLDLPGTGPLRIYEADVANYACLTRNLGAADAFYALPGMNSFYFWTRKDPPSTINATSWHAVLSPHRQRLVRADVEPHERLMVLVGMRFSVSPWLSEVDQDAQPLAHYIWTSTASLGRIGMFDVRARLGWTPHLVDCARIESDTVHVRVASRLDRTIARIVVVDSATGVMLSDSASSADGGNWQQLDDAGAATHLEAGIWNLDLARDRHLTLHGTAPLASIRATQTPVVRVLDARSHVVARLPFLR